MTRLRVALGCGVLVASAMTVPIVFGGGSAAAAADPDVESVCAGTLVGSTYTLTANCQTTQPLTIAQGVTLNGAGFTMTATGSAFGAVLMNAGTSMNIEKLTIAGQFTGSGNCPSIGSCLDGIFFDEASGSVNGVNVIEITLHSGLQVGRAIQVVATTAQTVTITNSTITGYEKSGVIAQGPSTTVDVSASTIGPPDPLHGVLAQNGVTYLSGAGGTVGRSTIFGTGYGVSTNNDTAILMFNAGQVTVRGNNITGPESDVGVDVFGTTGAVIDHNHIGRTSADIPDTFGIGVLVETGSSATLTCNTFSGWLENVSGTSPQADCPGYWMAATDGGIFNFGAGALVGSMGGTRLNAPIVGIASAPDGGYWMAASDGGVFSFGLGFFGSMGGIHLNKPVVGIASSRDGSGYYLVASDGGVFAFGSARFQGSMGGTHLNAPMVGMDVTPDNRGYYLVAADGGVFAFGDAQFQGSMGGTHINKPVVDMAVDVTTSGYWLVASDGGVFSFGAPYLGSTGALHLNAPVVGMAATGDGLGYRLVASDGGVFAFPDATFIGSMGGKPLNAPMVGMASTG